MTSSSEWQIDLTVNGQALSISQLCEFSNSPGKSNIRMDSGIHARMAKSASVVENAVDQNSSVYGVTTGFGGMAGIPVPRELAAASQNNLLAFLACGAGSAIDKRHVRAAMLLRANVLARGYSGVRAEIVERLIEFLQRDATPVVRDLGSIGASGDLVPLAVIARAITGQTDFVQVQIAGQTVDGPAALKKLGFQPLELLPKEGLAIVNGTSFSSAIAAHCVYESRHLLSLSFLTHAMMMASLLTQDEPFEDFVHQQKPHPGQIWSARMIKRLLQEGRNDTNGQPVHVQDRYSLRCFPQYMGPIVEGLIQVSSVIETEMNAVSDNPLVDVQNGRFYQSGNFLGQYVGIAMDNLRRHIGLLAKHLDVQIGTLVAPEFNHGLPASLRGNDDLSYNMGLKGLQITGNSIMPMLTYLGNPIVEHFPTHAEQFNQNINGLSWGAASLAWRSVELFQHYVCVAMIFSIQALDLRAKANFGHYDGRILLGTLTNPVYESVCQLLDVEPGPERPLIWDDCDQWLEDYLQRLAEDIRSNGQLVASAAPVLNALVAYPE